jgi:hypothetical protein
MRANCRIGLAMLAGVLVVVATTAVAGAGEDTMRHSGTIVEIDPAAGVLVLEEVGPWRVVNGETVVTRVTIGLTDSTRFASFIRVDAPGGYRGDFLEVPLDAYDVAPGDYVTIDCLHTGTRMTALSVAVAEIGPHQGTTRRIR